MADSLIYAGQSLLFGSTDVPFVDGSLDIQGDVTSEELMSGNSLTPDLRTITAKRPSIVAEILDPSLLTAIQPVGALETITAVKAVFRAYEQNGGPGTTYKSINGAQGIVMPVTLKFDARTRATLSIRFLAAFAGGTALAHGTASDAAATVSKAYFPTSLAVGGDTITNIQSGTVQWDHAIDDDKSLEPAHYVYRKAIRSGQIVTQDLSMVSAGRMEDGAVQAVVLTLTDREGGGTVAIDLGDCLVTAMISNNQATIKFAEVTG